MRPGSYQMIDGELVLQHVTQPAGQAQPQAAAQETDPKPRKAAKPKPDPVPETPSEERQ